jgi:threonine efflux protein
MIDAGRTYGRFFRLIEGSFGALFGIIGARVVLDGIKGLRA